MNIFITKEKSKLTVEKPRKTNFDHINIIGKGIHRNQLPPDDIKEQITSVIFLKIRNYAILKPLKKTLAKLEMGLS